MAAPRNSDFYVEFGSNAKTFSDELPGELSGAKRAIASLRQDIQSLYDDTKGTNPSLAQGLIAELREANDAVKGMVAGIRTMGDELTSIVAKLGRTEIKVPVTYVAEGGVPAPGGTTTRRAPASTQVPQSTVDETAAQRTAQEAARKSAQAKQRGARASEQAARADTSTADAAEKSAASKTRSAQSAQAAARRTEAAESKEKEANQAAAQAAERRAEAARSAAASSTSAADAEVAALESIAQQGRQASEALQNAARKAKVPLETLLQGGLSPTELKAAARDLGLEVGRNVKATSDAFRQLQERFNSRLSSMRRAIEEGGYATEQLQELPPSRVITPGRAQRGNPGAIAQVAGLSEAELLNLFKGLGGGSGLAQALGISGRGSNAELAREIHSIYGSLERQASQAAAEVVDQAVQQAARAIEGMRLQAPHSVNGNNVVTGRSEAEMRRLLSEDPTALNSTLTKIGYAGQLSKGSTGTGRDKAIQAILKFQESAPEAPALERAVKHETEATKKVAAAKEKKAEALEELAAADEHAAALIQQEAAVTAESTPVDPRSAGASLDEARTQLIQRLAAQRETVLRRAKKNRIEDPAARRARAQAEAELIAARYIPGPEGADASVAAVRDRIIGEAVHGLSDEEAGRVASGVHDLASPYRYKQWTRTKQGPTEVGKTLQEYADAHSRALEEVRANTPEPDTSTLQGAVQASRAALEKNITAVDEFLATTRSIVELTTEEYRQAQRLLGREGMRGVRTRGVDILPRAAMYGDFQGELTDRPEGRRFVTEHGGQQEIQTAERFTDYGPRARRGEDFSANDITDRATVAVPPRMGLASWMEGPYQYAKQAQRMAAARRYQAGVDVADLERKQAVYRERLPSGPGSADEIREAQALEEQLAEARARFQEAEAAVRSTTTAVVRAAERLTADLRDGPDRSHLPLDLTPSDVGGGGLYGPTGMAIRGPESTRGAVARPERPLTPEQLALYTGGRRYSDEDLAAMTRTEMQAALRAASLPATGTNAAMQERLAGVVRPGAHEIFGRTEAAMSERSMAGLLEILRRQPNLDLTQAVPPGLRAPRNPGRDASPEDRAQYENDRANYQAAVRTWQRLRQASERFDQFLADEATFLENLSGGAHDEHMMRLQQMLGGVSRASAGLILAGGTRRAALRANEDALIEETGGEVRNGRRMTRRTLDEVSMRGALNELLFGYRPGLISTGIDPTKTQFAGRNAAGTALFPNISRRNFDTLMSEYKGGRATAAEQTEFGDNINQLRDILYGPANRRGQRRGGLYGSATGAGQLHRNLVAETDRLKEAGFYPEDPASLPDTERGNYMRVKQRYEKAMARYADLWEKAAAQVEKAFGGRESYLDVETVKERQQLANEAVAQRLQEQHQARLQTGVQFPTLDEAIRADTRFFRMVPDNSETEGRPAHAEQRMIAEGRYAELLHAQRLAQVAEQEGVGNVPFAINEGIGQFLGLPRTGPTESERRAVSASMAKEKYGDQRRAIMEEVENAQHALDRGLPSGSEERLQRAQEKRAEFLEHENELIARSQTPTYALSDEHIQAVRNQAEAELQRIGLEAAQGRRVGPNGELARYGGVDVRQLEGQSFEEMAATYARLASDAAHVADNLERLAGASEQAAVATEREAVADEQAAAREGEVESRAARPSAIGKDECCERIVAELRKIQELLSKPATARAARQTASRGTTNRRERILTTDAEGNTIETVVDSGRGNTPRTRRAGNEAAAAQDAAQRAADREARRAAANAERYGALPLAVQRILERPVPAGQDPYRVGAQAVLQYRSETGATIPQATRRVSEALGLDRGSADRRRLRDAVLDEQLALDRLAATERQEARDKAAAEKATRSASAADEAYAGVLQYLSAEAQRAVVEVQRLNEARRTHQPYNADELRQAQVAAYSLVNRDLSSVRVDDAAGGTRSAFPASERAAATRSLIGSPPAGEFYDIQGRARAQAMMSTLTSGAIAEAPQFQSKLMTALFGTSGFAGRSVAAAGHAASRFFGYGLVFGVTNELQKTLRAATETQAEFVRISDALKANGEDAGNLRSQLQSISSSLATPLEEVYVTASQLVGVFHNTRDVEFATRAVEQLKLISRGALSAQEGITALQSVSQNYGLTGGIAFQNIVDKMTAIQNVTGINVENLLEGAGGFAATANQYGFTGDRGLTLSAILTGSIAQRTNQSGTAASEQLSRILSSLNSARARTTLSSMGLASDQQLQTGDFYDILLNIIHQRAAGHLTDQQMAAITNLAGPRQARTFAGAIGTQAEAQTTERAILAAQNAQGAGAQRVRALMHQLNREVQQLSTNFTNLGTALIQGGILSGLQKMLELLNSILRTAGRVGDALNWAENLPVLGRVVSTFKDIAIYAGTAWVALKLIGATMQAINSRAAAVRAQLGGGVSGSVVGFSAVGTGAATGGTAAAEERYAAQQEARQAEFAQASATRRLRMEAEERFTALPYGDTYNSGLRRFSGIKTQAALENANIRAAAQQAWLTGAGTYSWGPGREAPNRYVSTGFIGPLREDQLRLDPTATRFNPAVRATATLGTVGARVLDTPFLRLGRTFERVGAEGSRLNNISSAIGRRFSAAGAAMSEMGVSSQLLATRLAAASEGMSLAGIAMGALNAALLVIPIAIAGHQARMQAQQTETDMFQTLFPGAQPGASGRNSNNQNTADQTAADQYYNDTKKQSSGFLARVGAGFDTFGDLLTFRGGNARRAAQQAVHGTAGPLGHMHLSVLNHMNDMTLGLYQDMQENNLQAADIAKKFDAEAKRIQDDTQSTPTQKADALRHLLFLRNQLTDAFESVHAKAKGIVDIDRMTTEQLGALGELMTATASMTGSQLKNFGPQLVQIYQQSGLIKGGSASETLLNAVVGVTPKAPGARPRLQDFAAANSIPDPLSVLLGRSTGGAVQGGGDLASLLNPLGTGAQTPQQSAYSNALNDWNSRNSDYQNYKKVTGGANPNTQTGFNALQSKLADQLEKQIPLLGETVLSDTQGSDKYKNDLAQYQQLIQMDGQIRASIAQEAVNSAATLAQILLGQGDTKGAIAALNQAAAADEANAKQFKAGSAEYNQAMLDAQSKRRAALDAQYQPASLAAQLGSAQSRDPVAQAQGNVTAAQNNLNEMLAGRKAGNVGITNDDITNARIALANANNAVAQAVENTANAAGALFIAQTKDPFEKSRRSIADLQRQIGVAQSHGDQAAVSQLQAQLISAMEQADQLAAQAAAAHYNLLEAIATAAGHTVSAARYQLKAAQDNYKRVLAANGGNTRAPDVQNARAAVVQARANVRDTKLQDTQDDLRFQYDMGKLSLQGYIAQLRALLKQRDLTKQQRQQIQETIKGLSDQNAGMWNFGDIQMPTPYEVRRLEKARAQGLNYDASKTTYVGAQQAAAVATNSTTNNQTNNVTINTAVRLEQIEEALRRVLGVQTTQRLTTTTRRS